MPNLDFKFKKAKRALAVDVDDTCKIESCMRKIYLVGSVILVPIRELVRTEKAWKYLLSEIGLFCIIAKKDELFVR